MRENTQTSRSAGTHFLSTNTFSPPKTGGKEMTDEEARAVAQAIIPLLTPQQKIDILKMKIKKEDIL